MKRLRQTLNVLSSMEFTLFSLGLMMVVVFTGTLAQVDLGTYNAQQVYFNSLFVYRDFFGWRVPILPGGLLVGGIWFINLTAAFWTRFRFRKQTPGLIVSHGGLLLLLLGQFLTQTLAKENQMAIELTQTKQYAESLHHNELVFIDTTAMEFDEVVSVPQRLFRHPGTLAIKELPFTVKVLKHFPNADLSMGMPVGSPVTQGIGTQILIKEKPPVAADGEFNAESVFLEILAGERSLGVWLVSAVLGAPQVVNIEGKTYSLALRPRRTYYPFTVTLKEFKHDRYPGTEIAKNFSSLVTINNPGKQEQRDALIYMNNPLRYEGRTFYQSSFGKNDTLSVFQVVDNPAWLTPYISCLLVAVGLAIQFISHFIAFSRKRRSA